MADDAHPRTVGDYRGTVIVEDYVGFDGGGRAQLHERDAARDAALQRQRQLLR